MADRFVLYDNPGSTCAQRVRFALAVKGIGFQSHKLDLLAGDQLKPEYLALNPNGVVPTLVHNGEIITDSAVILEYLDEIAPTTEPLRPAGGVALARMRAMLHYIDEMPAAAVRVPSFNLAFLPAFRKMTDAAFVALADSKPLRREFLLAMGRTGFPQADMDQALDRLRRSCARMHDWITTSGGPWVMGERMTLPDIAIMPTLVRLEELRLAHLWEGYPAISAWLDRITAHAAFAPTYYPGALLGDRFAHLGAARRR